MSEMRLEAISLIDKFPEESLAKVVMILKNFLQEEDHFYSEENQKYLRESIREFEERKVVSFSDEEWEKSNLNK